MARMRTVSPIVCADDQAWAVVGQEIHTSDTPYRESCPFCVEFDPHVPVEMTQFGRIGGSESCVRLAHRTEHLVVLPTLGPLALGHTLLATRWHLPSFGHVPDAWLDELVLEYGALRDFLEARVGPVVVFEHGAMSSAQPAGSCIDHAHMHFLPLAHPATVRPIVGASMTARPLAELRDLSQFVERQTPYVYLHEHDGTRWVFDASGPLPCQLMRRAGAALCAIADEWDWYLFPRIDVLRATLGLLGEYARLRGPCDLATDDPITRK